MIWIVVGMVSVFVVGIMIFGAYLQSKVEPGNGEE